MTDQTRRSIAWAAILVVGTAGVAVALWSDGYRLPPLWAIVVLGGIAAVAERQGVAVTDRTYQSVSFLPLVFAALAFGPLGGLIVGAVSNVWDVRESRLKWVVYTPIRALTAATAGAAAWAFFPHPTGLGQYLLTSLAASLADLLAEVVLVGTTARIRNLNARDVLLTMASVSWLTVPLYVPLLALLLYTYETYSLHVALILFVPTLAAQRLLHLYQQEKEATRHLASANARLLTANARFATGLVAMLEESDPYTAGHSLAVATYSRDIAERMGLSDDDVELVHLCALVHDIGKYRLPKSVLEKDGPLNLEERRLMEKHPEYGEELLRKVEVEDHGRIGKIVRHHHERIDGEGYPDRLPESEIPLLSKIISVADAYNAMTSKRSYRDAMPSQVARLRLAQ
ncbi:MAG TPA: HD domain-containing phosphohydrolase, partial [Fimbriimonadaceae bacterium]|nr:HD domain-containing phosphohydrolase [Fimbriimonadaceae bacterium]